MGYVKVENQRKSIEFEFRYRECNIHVQKSGPDHWLARVFPWWSSGKGLFCTPDSKKQATAIERALRWVDRNGESERPVPVREEYGSEDEAMHHSDAETG